MSSLSDYLEQSILNNIFRGQSIATLPSTLYYSLHTSATTDAGGGTEVSGNNYSRAALARNVTTNYDAPSGGATQNAVAIAFPTPSGAWGTATHMGVWDASSGGNLLLHGALETSKVIDNGDPVSFAVGDLDIELTGAFSDYLRDVILNWLFRNGTWPTWDANVSVSLHTGAPGGTGANEVSGGGYARVAVARNTTNWTAPDAGGAVSNTGQITFPSPTGSWGSIQAAGLWDGGGADFLFAVTMSARTVNAGDQPPYMAASALTVTLS